MYEIADQLNSKLLALTAQLGALRSDIDDLESEFIELSKELSDLSAELEAQTPDPRPEEIYDGLIKSGRTHMRAKLMMGHFGYRSVPGRNGDEVLRIWVKK